MSIRIIAVLLCVVAGLASTSASGPSPSQPEMTHYGAADSGEMPSYQGPKAPLAESMKIEQALGIWNSNFGSVKIERDSTKGKTGLMGVWVYTNGAIEVIGYFEGRLNGNILEFDWNEPNENKILQGKGYLKFEVDGSHFSGPWWSQDGERTGEFRANKIIE